MKKLWIPVCVLIIAGVLLSLAGCAEIKNDPAGEQGSMKVDLTETGMVRNGTEYRTFQVEKGKRGIVSVRISRQSGVLELDIYPTDRPKEPEYTGRSLDSASFSVILEEQGEYKVRVAAKDYVGDYEIDWKTEPVEKEWNVPAVFIK